MIESIIETRTQAGQVRKRKRPADEEAGSVLSLRQRIGASESWAMRLRPRDAKAEAKPKLPAKPKLCEL